MGKMPDYRYTYCLFCRTGIEKKLCDEICRKLEGVYPLIAVQEKHRVINKRYEIDRRILLPGYLFLYSNETIDFTALLKVDHIYRILGDETSAHELQGSDRAFAEWLFRNDGLIGISKIQIRDGKIFIRSGPMKYFRKETIRIDKHTKNALIKMDFLGTTREMWLAFEFDDEGAIEDREEKKNEEV